MTLAIMQPYLFPYIGYFQLMNLADVFVLYDDVNYINKGWVNRNRICMNGASTYFTVPLSEASQNKKICDIEIACDEKCRAKLLSSFRHAYSKAPNFRQVFPILEEIMNQENTNLSLFIFKSLEVISKYLDITTPVLFSSQQFSSVGGKGQERILAICNEMGCNHYVNPINGMALYSQDYFLKSGIELSFIQVQNVPYSAKHGNEFIPFLSIIDELMNVESSGFQNGRLRNYKLIKE